MSEKHLTGILIGIALNLQVSLTFFYVESSGP